MRTQKKIINSKETEELFDNLYNLIEILKNIVKKLGTYLNYG